MYISILTLHHARVSVWGVSPSVEHYIACYWPKVPMPSMSQLTAHILAWVSSLPAQLLTPALTR